ncbi:restriction endonuclease subunit S [Pseudomonas sp. HY2-MNA-CIBAN-0224]|uniref:restriction endonuclease subunit S n=1 Tax=Pseudomonas sp. HY2-MNA-CIBAN-0224 TaxID=3140471 RepID=UPI003316514F
MAVKPGYKQTEVGVIPEEWCVRPLLTTVRIASGQVSPKVEPYRSMVLVAPDHIESSTGRLLAKKTALEQRAISGKYVFESGDIVYSKIRPYLRKAIRANFAGLCSADMYPLKPADDVSSGFMLAIVLGYRFSKYAESVSVRSGMPKINRTELAEFALGLPPLPEQSAIATVLSDVDALLGALERLIAKKRDLKQAAMQQLLTGQTRLPGFSGEWEDTTLGAIGECIIGLTYHPDNVVEHGLLVLRSSNVQGGRLAYDNNVYVDIEVNERLITTLGDILICVRNGSRTLIGKSAVIDECAAGTTFGAFMTVYRTVHWRFISHAFQSESIQRQIRDNIGATINQITNKDMKALRLKLPSSSEQTAIAAVLTDMDAELAALEQRLTKTRALKQGMMQELLTGRTRLL